MHSWSLPLRVNNVQPYPKNSLEADFWFIALFLRKQVFCHSHGWLSFRIYVILSFFKFQAKKSFKKSKNWFSSKMLQRWLYDPRWVSKCFETSKTCFSSTLSHIGTLWNFLKNWKFRLYIPLSDSNQLYRASKWPPNRGIRVFYF